MANDQQQGGQAPPAGGNPPAGGRPPRGAKPQITKKGGGEKGPQWKRTFEVSGPRNNVLLTVLIAKGDEHPAGQIVRFMLGKEGSEHTKYLTRFDDAGRETVATFTTVAGGIVQENINFTTERLKDWTRITAVSSGWEQIKPLPPPDPLITETMKEKTKRLKVLPEGDQRSANNRHHREILTYDASGKKPAEGTVVFSSTVPVTLINLMTNAPYVNGAGVAANNIRFITLNIDPNGRLLLEVRPTKIKFQCTYRHTETDERVTETLSWK